MTNDNFIQSKWKHKYLHWWRWRHGKLAVFDISEPGGIIAEKLLILLSARQRQELVNYLLDSQKQQNNLADSQCIISETYKLQTVIDEPFIEIRIGDLYFCQEQRLVCIGEQIIELTAKEFDILALLIAHPKRVFTYELIMELVWNEDYSLYSRKAVNNHVSNLRRKLKTTSGSPDYIKSVVGVGYKFEVT